MDFKILAENIKNNPDDFTAEQIETLFDRAYRRGENNRNNSNPIIKKIHKTTDVKEIAQLEELFHRTFIVDDDDDNLKVALIFGKWLNYFFEIWNSDDGTWMDANKRAWTTKELFDEFVKSYKI